MLLESKYKPRKPKRNSSFETFKTAGYTVLCLALAGLLVWIWWPKHPARPGPVATGHPVPRTVPTLPAPTVVTPPLITTNPIVIVRPPPMATLPTPAQTTDIFEAQIALARQGICPGSIDGKSGSQTRSALLAFQRKMRLPPTGLLDAATKSLLQTSSPLTTEYIVTGADLTRLLPIAKTWLGKSEQPRLDYETILELLGEKAFSNPQLIRALNPGIDWDHVTSGTKVTLPAVEYPPITDKAAFAKISLRDCIFEAFDSRSNLLVHFPCSIGRVAAKRPAGTLHVANIAIDPNYTFDPAVFTESPAAQAVGRKLIIPPGPNNPVGVAWIGLDRPGYGIHGTPAPEKVGRTESHGCFRLANWNAAYLVNLVWIGMPVIVE